MVLSRLVELMLVSGKSEAQLEKLSRIYQYILVPSITYAAYFKSSMASSFVLVYLLSLPTDRFKRMQQEADFSVVTHLTVTASHQGQRVDNYMLARLKGVPRSRIYSLLRKGEIRVNKKRTKPDYRLVEGDVVRVAPIRVATATELPEPSPELSEKLMQSVLYEDDNLLVLNKPAGMASHGGTGVRLGFIEAVRQVWQNKNLELAHRLDKGTSGCIIVTKNLAAGKCITDQFRLHQVRKTYHALVQGKWPAGTTRVDSPLLRLPAAGGERLVKVSEDGKKALTVFRLLKAYRTSSLIEAKPASGRTHQIRVHAQLQGHPLLGDEKYSRNGDGYTYWKKQGIQRLCLHAATLEFTRPDGSTLIVEAPADDSFNTALAVVEAL